MPLKLSWERLIHLSLTMVKREKNTKAKQKKAKVLKAKVAVFSMQSSPKRF